MQLRLRTKLTIVMTGLVLLVVAVLSGVFLVQLLQQTLLDTDKRASDLAQPRALRRAALPGGSRLGALARAGSGFAVGRLVNPPGRYRSRFRTGVLFLVAAHQRRSSIITSESGLP